MLIVCVIPYPQGIYISRGLRRCSFLLPGQCESLYRWDE